MSCLIIAEIGENHFGRMPLAKRMIEEAAIAGADMVKFQSYRGRDFKDDDPEKEWFCQVELSDKRHFELKTFAERVGVEFLSSPFTLERARFLVETLGLKKIKIASGVMMKFDILDYLNTAHIEELFISTGMTRVSEIRESLSHLKNIQNINILHCTTQYPCKDEDANLLALRALKKEFRDYQIGYSDHTIGIDACAVAVGFGARIIEKHFTLNKNWREGTDHVLSATPGEFKEMIERIKRIKRIKRIEVMIGSGIKEPTSSEKEILGFVRKRFIG